MSHCESPYFRIGLGDCGATDCCLTLTFINKVKQYGVESEGWRALVVIEHAAGRGTLIPRDSYKGAILKLVWDHCDDDIFEGGE